MNNTTIILSDGTEKSVKLKVLSPLLKIQLGKLESEYKQISNKYATELFQSGKFTEYLTPDEVLTVGMWTKIYNELSENDKQIKKNKDTEKIKNMSEIIEKLQPIYAKLQNVSNEIFEDKFLIDKFKLVIDAENDETIIEMLKLDSDNDVWLMQSMQKLNEVNNFFRGKRT